MAEHDETEQEQQTESRDFKRLREQNEALTAEVGDLKTKLLNHTIRTAGFDPDLGIVKRLAKDFDGDIDDIDAFKAFVTAEGLTAPAQEQRQQSETEQQIDQLQNRADDLRDLGRPADTKTVREQIADAEARGDYDAARALKNQLLLDSAA